jgi:uncharacterized protein (TIGR03905 family)
MIKEYTHNCVGTCSSSITISYDTDTNKLVDIKVVGGCPGNLKGIISLCKGQDMDEVYKKLHGITCRTKSTSCPDQLADTILEAKNN